MLNPREMKLKNIRVRESSYAIRFTKRTKTLSGARRLKKIFNKYIDGVGIYEDTSKGNFMVQTYKEYSNLIDAIKIRDYIRDCKEIWEWQEQID